jgi:HAD superfamily hydrolase (TIGR01509 family)
MNIIIPLGGKGTRFSSCGYKTPKPMIPIFDKSMIEYMLDNLIISSDDKIFIIYNYFLDSCDFSILINNKYPFINLIRIDTDTKGAVETLFLGIEIILKKFSYNDKCLILDCDTFYTEDIVSIFKNSNENTVFYTKNYDTNPIYSYIEINNSIITNIKEKDKISDNANTGAYGFIDINILNNYCKYILDNNITFNGEPYTSCIISEMIKNGLIFKGVELIDKFVFSLGTPTAVQKYIDNTYAFLFDLDGTLVITDDIYFDVWYNILIEYNIILTKEIFNNYIQGNNDKYVVNNLLINNNINISELSKLKDELFIKNINKIIIIDGVYDIIKEIKLLGYKICIVTNCNNIVAKQIIKNIKIDKFIDFIISNNDCINGKPSSEPYKKAIDKYNINNQKCIIFEDSKTGFLSAKGINPKLLIGIETNYCKNELLNYGCNLSFKDYSNLNINNIINNDTNIIVNLKNIIKKNSIIKDIKCIHIDEDKLKGGFISDVLSFQLVTNDGKIYSKILKYENTQQNNLSIMAKKLELYEREYYFYTDIARDINVYIPIFYNLIIDQEYNNKGIILENLFEKKYKLNLDLNIENIDITLKIVDRLAKMHSKYWNKNLKKIFPKLKGSNDIVFSPFFKEFIYEKYEEFKNKWFKILNKNQIEISNKIYNNFVNIQNRFSQGTNLTFIHGDVKSPNIFYDIQNNYEPYFIDWQHCAIGKGVQDIIFFIIESFNISNIKVIFNLIKHYYYTKLIEYGITNYSFQDYENDIYDAICYIPFFTSVWFGTTSQDELIDKNFPYFLINKMFYLLEYIESNNNINIF